MTPELIAMQLFSGVALGSILIMLALGLSIVFGMLGVVNFAHGAFFMVGAYAGWVVLGLTGSFWWALLIAPVAVGLNGSAIYIGSAPVSSLTSLNNQLNDLFKVAQ